MSDLGAIFHVTADGKQYDAHAYTTLDECPEPNLKLTYKGQHGYVKLVDKGSGNVPCYVKPKSGSTVYQVKKRYESIPTGSLYCDGVNNTFTVPSGIRVLSIEIVGYESFGAQYVGVTPGKTYENLHGTEKPYDEGAITQAYVTRGDYPNQVFWAFVGDEGYEELEDGRVEYTIDFTIKWSPEINKKTPSYTDY